MAAKPMNRICPTCSAEAVAVSGLIVSDARCANCGQLVGVQWVYRAIFFVLILLAAVPFGLIVFFDQGLYAALLTITLPIGAIGYIKARFCPLVARKRRGEAGRGASS